jgi:hypothetical protein
MEGREMRTKSTAGIQLFLLIAAVFLLLTVARAESIF